MRSSIAIAAITPRPRWFKEIAKLQKMGVNVAVQFLPGRRPERRGALHRLGDQGGLGMPDRDYYTKTDLHRTRCDRSTSPTLRALTLCSPARPIGGAEDARRVMALETELAKASMTRVQRRDPNATYHKTTVARPRTRWPRQSTGPFTSARSGMTTSRSRIVNVGQPEFHEARQARLITTLPLEDWSAYLRYHLISDARRGSALRLPKKILPTARFTAGAKEMLPRWKRAFGSPTASLAKHSARHTSRRRSHPPPRRRQSRSSTISGRHSAIGCSKLTWMSDSTRKFALSKAREHERESWLPRPVARLQQARSRPRDRSRRTCSAQTHSNGSALQIVPGKPVDKTEWGMTVPTVNAYYDPSINEMVFPCRRARAADVRRAGDLASNYGSLGGSWAGHELTHGFDDRGTPLRCCREICATGGRQPIRCASIEQAKLIVDQFNGYIQVDTIHVNGALTLGENLADFGGLVIAYDALERALDRSGQARDHRRLHAGAAILHRLRAVVATAHAS